MSGNNYIKSVGKESAHVKGLLKFKLAREINFVCNQLSFGNQIGLRYIDMTAEKSQSMSGTG